MGTHSLKKLKFQTFCEGSTIHGLRYMGGTQIGVVRRVVWMLVFGGLQGYLMYVLYNSLKGYYRYETTISTSMHKATDLEFPAVTICPMTDDIRTLLTMERFSGDTGFTDWFAGDISAEVTAIAFMREWQSPDGNCYFQSELCHFNAVYIANLQRLCFTSTLVSSSADRNYVRANTTGGLSNEKSLSLNLLWQILQQPMQIMFHHPKVMPSSKLQTYGSTVGEQVFIGLKQEITTALGSPYSETGCISDEQDPDYDEGSCLNECISAVYLSRCNCSVVNDVQNCSRFDYYDEYITQCLDNTAEYRRLYCSHCVPNCVQTTYKATLTSTTLTTPNMFFFIYYDSLDYTLYKEVALVDLVQLLSTIGGLLGLFVGTSIMSFIEIVDWVFYRILAGDNTSAGPIEGNDNSQDHRCNGEGNKASAVIVEIQ